MGGPYRFDDNFSVIKKLIARMAVKRDMLSSMPFSGWIERDQRANLVI